MIRSWLTALRISRREARRARGRTAMVVAMIAVPVCALGYAAASADMLTLTPAESATRTLGAADALVMPVLDGPITQAADGELWQPESPGEARAHAPMTEADMLSVLPHGSRLVPMFAAGQTFRTASQGLADTDVTEMDLTDPIYRGMVEVLDGRGPSAPGEVAMSEAARARFGDTIQTRERDRTWTVVGTVEFPADLGEVMVFAPGALPRAEGEQPLGRWLADTPAPLDWADVQRLNRLGIAVTSRAVLLDPPDPSVTAMPYDNPSPNPRLALAPIVTGLAVLEIILLAGPAFAVGARRRQRSLALVAANGGTRAHLRRIVLADGLTLGLTGAAIGVTCAVALAAAVRPLAEELLIGERFGGYRFNPPMLAGIVALAVVTGLAAAAVPAFTAARLDVVAALTGRRGVVRSRRRWLTLGLALAAAGVAIAAWGSRRTGNGEMGTELIVAGLALGQIGLVLCTPSLIGLIARFGGALPPAPRIALRDTARNRASSAPAVSAVMASVAGTVALGVYLFSTQAQMAEGHMPSMPYGHVGVDYGDAAGAEARQRVRAAVTGTLPGVGVTEVSEVACADPALRYCGASAIPPPANRCPGEETEPVTRAEVEALADDPRCDRIWHHSGLSFRSAVGGRETLVALTGATGADLDRAAAVLERGGVVVGDPALLDDDGMVLVELLAGTDGQTDEVPPRREVTVPGYALEAGRFGADLILSPEAVRQTGFVAAPAGLVAATTDVPAEAVLDRLNLALAEAGVGRAFVEAGPDTDTPPMLWMLVAASALITLGAAGMATGLAAADGRADLSTLAAIGAAPRVRRMLSLSQSGVITGLGSVLGVLAGIGSAFAVLAARNETIAGQWPLVPLYPFTVPWANLLLIMSMPLVAMLGAGLLTRSRLPIERRRPT